MPPSDPSPRPGTLLTPGLDSAESSKGPITASYTRLGTRPSPTGRVGRHTRPCRQAPYARPHTARCTAVAEIIFTHDLPRFTGLRCPCSGEATPQALLEGGPVATLATPPSHPSSKSQSGSPNNRGPHAKVSPRTPRAQQGSSTWRHQNRRAGQRPHKQPQARQGQASSRVYPSSPQMKECHTSYPPLDGPSSGQREHSLTTTARHRNARTRAAICSPSWPAKTPVARRRGFRRLGRITVGSWPMHSKSRREQKSSTTDQPDRSRVSCRV